MFHLDPVGELDSFVGSKKGLAGAEESGLASAFCIDEKLSSKSKPLTLLIVDSISYERGWLKEANCVDLTRYPVPG